VFSARRSTAPFLFSFIGSYIYEHHLLAVHNSSTGIQVRLVSSDGEVIISEEFSNYYLPPECGEKFSRCQDLLVLPNELNKNVTQFVAAIPVTRAVLLLDIRDNGSGLLLHRSFIVNQTIEDCNPTSIFKIARSVYTMCFNERISFLTVIELRIQGSIQLAFFARPTLRGGSFDYADQVSNFLSVNSTDERYVVFASGTTLTAYTPTNSVMNPTYIPIQCSPKRIEQVCGGVVVAYCSDRSLSVDIVSKQTNTTLYNESGYPSICPDYPYIKLFAFKTYLQYQVLQGSQNFTEVISITGNGSSFDDSQCFGTGTTFFIYNDNGGIHVVNITSGREINLLPYGYLNPSFLSVIGSRYMVIQEVQNGTEAEISVSDSYKNLAEVVRTHGQKADLMAVVLSSRYIEPPSPNRTVIILATSIPMFVVLAVVLVVLVPVVVICIHRR